jgi:hypothetical protein
MTIKPYIIFPALAAAVRALPLLASAQENGSRSVTVPVVLDHNRMLVDAEIRRKDGSRRKALLWTDTASSSG